MAGGGTGISIYPPTPFPGAPEADVPSAGLIRDAAGNSWSPGGAGEGVRSYVQDWYVNKPWLFQKYANDPNSLTSTEMTELARLSPSSGLEGVPQPGSEINAYISMLKDMGLAGGSTATQSAATKKAAEEAAKKKALNQWYQQGGHLKQFETLRNALAGQTAAARQSAQGQYNTALQNILAGYSGAGQMIGTGYNAVADYLQRNMPNAYAGFQPVPVAPEQVSQGYFGAYGVDMQPVMAQIAADQQAAQYGAGAFTNLVDILNRSSQQAVASRQAELELARNLGMQTLGQQRAAMESSASSALQRALDELSASEKSSLYEIATKEAEAQAEADKALAPMRARQAKREAEAKARAKVGKGNKAGKK